MTATKTRPAPWTDRENMAIAALYFRMLDGTSRVGEKLNKAALVRIAQGNPSEADRKTTDTASFASQLDLRSRPSIEMKLMNCSAIHKDLGAEYTMDDHGYRAMPNYQRALKAALVNHIEIRVQDSAIAESHANEQRAGA